MRTAGTARAGAIAVAAGVVLLITAPLASAVEGGLVIVSPSNARSGQAVRVTATGCITASSAAVSRAYSSAFPTISLRAYKGGAPGAVTGTGTIFSGTKPGTYKVDVACDVNSGVSATGTLTVMGSGSSGSVPAASPSTSAAAVPALMPTPTTNADGPRGAARTGSGGVFSGANSGEVALGTALLGAALVTGFAIRRRAARKA